MAKDFDRTLFLNVMQHAVLESDRASLLGAELAHKNLRRIVFVGCGAPHRMMSVFKYWIEHSARNVETRLYYPIEMINLAPPILDEGTLVLLGSHSGTTAETIQAAEYLRAFPCTTVGITQSADSPFGKAVQHALVYGQSPDQGYQHGYYSFFMLGLALVSAILKATDGWPHHEAVMCSLPAFPTVLADSIQATEGRAAEAARLYRDERQMLACASGPMFCTAFVTALCVLMEMQWMQAFPIEAAMFFHGPFEMVDENTALILLLGEDPSRPEAERVVRFCKQHTEKLIILDSLDYEMKGIYPQVRGVFAPFVLQSTLDRFAEHLAVWHAHPLTTRRYMWKTDY